MKRKLFVSAMIVGAALLAGSIVSACGGKEDDNNKANGAKDGKAFIACAAPKVFDRDSLGFMNDCVGALDMGKLTHLQETLNAVKTTTFDVTALTSLACALYSLKTNSALTDYEKGFVEGILEDEQLKMLPLDELCK